MPVFGLIAAGNYDVAVLETLLKRLRPDLHRVAVRKCINDYRVTTTVATRISELARANDGNSVDKVIVVRDVHRSTIQRELQKLRDSVDPHHYQFPIEFAVVMPEIESWLLADHEALSTVTRERGVATVFPAPDRSPESLPSPKERLLQSLAQAKVPYTEAVAVRIAELASLTRIEQLCTSFSMFKRAAEHC